MVGGCMDLHLYFAHVLSIEKKTIIGLCLDWIC